MARRFVHATRGVAVDHYSSGSPFTDRARPARTIGDALGVASHGDVIEVLDTAYYQEDGLVIDKTLTIVSSAWLDPAVPKPMEERWRRNQYPAIGPRHRHRGRALLIHQRRDSIAPHIAGFVIRDGGTINEIPGDPAFGAGGGIAVVDCGTAMEEVTTPSGLIIEDCYFTNNQTRATRTGQTSLAPLTRHLRDVVNALLSPLETAATMTVLLRPLIPDQFRDRLEDTLDDITTGIQNLRPTVERYFARLPQTMPNHHIGGQSFGAGLCFVWSSGTVRGCVFDSNRVTGRGGGAAVVGYGWPLFDHCRFTRNHALAQTRRDGGGLGLEVAIPDMLNRDLRVEHLIADLDRWLSSLLTTFRGASDVAAFAFELMTAIVNYGVSVGLGRQPPPGPSEEDDSSASEEGEDGDEDDEAGRLASALLALVLQLLLKAYLQTRRYQLWNRRHLEAARRSRAVVRDCTFVHNQANDDGGAIYASVLSRIRLQRCELRSNRTHNAGGGGLRASMGSDTELDSCVVHDNRAFGDDFVVGGGGLAFRDVNVLITGETEIANNQCTHWAGGGIFCAAESEGGGSSFGPLKEILPGYFHAILTEVFEFRQMTVTIRGQVSITRNTAGRDRRSTHGKGGGLYILRGRQIDVPPLVLRIERFAANVVNNVGHWGAAAATDTYNQIALKDLAEDVDVGDRDSRRFLRGTDLRYSSGTT